MKVQQTLTFKRVAKRLHKRQKHALDEAVRQVMQDPSIGIRKKGDLSQVWVHKFKMDKEEFLLAYTVDESVLTLLALGVHENFYRTLKRHPDLG